ncbi:hypothetical protein BO94DRAFT_570544 [Aspergillus sclerotioniger CBS 115572]|uniref:Uncharacterized protein n=1 Tax=Aspergillus sclerotioniger CBS 115572 TaxID=1450535 RepID=A0A317XEH0_9EURO|nr:hypothetical protein BO94DRAFT_570544 [Aspergillus sclerotioniger CBS 115572]PWY96182.1 hypothetical protein BO94DRAFT_570544 [Aspergillus sclerotioniger CBS 115572]
MSPRWSKLSASANADSAYHKFLSETPDAYTYICICTRPGSNPNDDLSESNEEEIPPECDGGKTCVCFKPLPEHPDHPYTFSKAGLEKMITYRIMIDLRDPDSFGMYTFNDHAGMGALEVVQNALLDFRDAMGKADWRGMWAVCEGLGWLVVGNWVAPMMMIDDGGILDETQILFEHMFLCMLAELEKQGQLGPNSDVRNLGFVMGMYADEVKTKRSDFEIPDPEIQTKSRKGVSYRGQNFVPYLVAYATRRNITMHGPSNMDEIIAEAEEEAEQEDVVLPTGNKDPWKWMAALKAYEKKNRLLGYGGIRKTQVGGDALDITTFSSQERKRRSFSKQDPLTADMIQSIKDGLVLQLG